ncbi:glycosyltransferase [Nibricoccus sp. IMCC34717]|uniref:glycosyltransferase n=1 Tax=Nibricoccus sp. IMCC34717 TaxID=3034021 RepID=UPI00384C36C4
MIFLDTGKARAGGPKSGLNRVALRLAAELGGAARAVRWESGRWVTDDGAVPVAEDWILVPGLFSEVERPGLTAWLGQAGRARIAAVYHDAIPVRRPDLCFAHAVARHPGYLKLLASFNDVFCVSKASLEELRSYWEWAGVSPQAETRAIVLGADLPETGRVRVSALPATVPPRLLCVGILEPRKNQRFLLEVCEALWAGGAKFGLDLVGRVNPELGAPTEAAVRAAQKRGRDVRHLTGLDDRAMVELYAGAQALVFPTDAEGCGLPLLESLWLGVPCVHSDLAPLRENAEGGGTLAVPTGDAGAWAAALRTALFDQRWNTEARAVACARVLPTWAETAGQIQAVLGGR